MSPQPAFDYDALDEAIRGFMRHKADETRGLLKRTARHVLAIGRNLQEVKDRLPHGQFLAWLQAEFGMSERHARNFMHVAARFENKAEIIADLSLTIIYALAAPSTSQAVIEQVESKQISPTLETIRAAKEAERQASCCIEAKTCPYTLSVVLMSLCPSSSCTTLIGIPMANNMVAALCRRS